MLKRKSLADKLKNLFGIGKAQEELYDELEEILIEGDIGPRLTMEVVDKLKEKVKKEKLHNKEQFSKALKEILSSYLKTTNHVIEKGKLNFFLVLGVNGVGKTTTIAKMVEYFKKEHEIKKVMLSAGDTFRAAAIDQLKILGEQLGVKVISQDPGSDPGAVIYDSIVSALSKEYELVIADTAGRMHNKDHLVKELTKIDKIIKGKIGDGYYKKILVVDATTGQNALNQAEIFNNAVGIDSLVMAKYDSTAKGGIVLSICNNLGLPFSFMGTGEKMSDLVIFNKNLYLDSLVG